jgi:hypothetical protein
LRKPDQGTIRVLGLDPQHGEPCRRDRTGFSCNNPTCLSG